MVERVFLAMAGLGALLTSCAQVPSLTTDNGSDGVGDDSAPSVPEDEPTSGSGLSNANADRTPRNSDASNTRSTKSTRADAGEQTASAQTPSEKASAATERPEAGTDDARGAQGGGNGGSGASSAGPTVVGVSRTPAGAGACSVPGDAQLEDVSRPTTVIGSGSPGSCDGGAFVDAVAKGGVITFNCGPDPITIQVPRTAKVVNASRKVVIDGGGKVALSGGGSRRILYQNTCDPAQGHATAQCDNQDFPQLTIQNLTLVDGDARGTSEGDGGGAIFAQGGRLKIINSHFFRNKCVGTGADAGGGALRVFQQYNNQPVYIVNSTFGGSADRGNEGSNGGALSAIGVSYTLIGSTLTHNHAIGRGANPAHAGTPGGGSGGAIYLDGNDFHLRVCGSEIAHNTANEHGGGIFFVSNNRTGSMRIENSTLSDNDGGAFETHPGMYVEASGEPGIANSQLR